MTHLLNLIPKENIDLGRDALLEAFVDQHFDPETGQSLCQASGFYDVLYRLGRPDLDLGTESAALGRLTNDEVTKVSNSYSQRRKISGSRRGMQEQEKQSPLYKRLSTCQRLIFEALDRAGKKVINPAAATTIAQAILEEWFEVPLMLVGPDDLLKQSSEQGDAHAAYLLATFYVSRDCNISGHYIEPDESERRKYMAYALSQGSESAKGSVRDESERQDWYTQEDVNFDAYCDSRYELKAAIEKGQDAVGDRLFDAAMNLRRLNQDFIRGCPPEKFKALREEWRNREKLWLGWVEKASQVSAKARHYLGKQIILVRSSSVLEDIGLSKDPKPFVDLLESSVWPEEGVKPYHPALVDLAHIYSIKETPFYDLSSAKKCVDQAVTNIRAIDSHGGAYTSRLANLHEKIYGDSDPKTTIALNARSSTWSIPAAYRAAILSLRSAKNDDAFQACREYFEACTKCGNRGVGLDDARLQNYAAVALEIGWGSSEFGSNRSSWNGAAAILIGQLHSDDYKTGPYSRNLTESDIEKLFLRNSRYLTYAESKHKLGRQVREFMASPEESIEDKDTYQKSRAKRAVRRNYAYGACEPLAFIKALTVLAGSNAISSVGLKADRGIDAGTIFSEFLLGQLYLKGRFFDADGKVKALAHFENAKALAETFGKEPGAKGRNVKADALRWIEPLISEGMLEAQPDTITLELDRQLDGSVVKFGSRMLDSVLRKYPNAKFPKSGSAVSLVYSDRYINTPIKVALLANWIASIRNYLDDQERWKCKAVEIKTSTEMGRQGHGNSYNESWPDFKERDMVLRQTVEVVAGPCVVSSSGADHRRGLTIKFDDGALFTFWLDSGVSHWEADDPKWAPFNVEDPVEAQASHLASTQVKCRRVLGSPPVGWLRWVDVSIK